LTQTTFAPQKYFGWDTGYERIDWWWEGVRSTETDRRYFRYGKGVPLDGNKGPVILPTPAEYDANLTRAKKILFLLNEIQTLDHSKSKIASDCAARCGEPCCDLAPD